MSQYPDLTFIYGSEDIFLTEEEKSRLRDIKSRNQPTDLSNPPTESSSSLQDRLGSHFTNLQGISTSTSPSRTSETSQPSKISPTEISAKISFKSIHGYYICAERPSLFGNYISANRKECKNFEKWTAFEFGKNEFAFKSYHGYYLTVDQQSKILYHSASEISDAEIWIREDLNDNTWALLNKMHKTYFTVEKNGKCVSNRKVRDQWEKLSVTFH